MTSVYLGLGGNLGDPLVQIEAAIRRLERAGVDVLARSSAYRTAPWGLKDQPEFVNLCVAGETALDARALLARIQEIEAGLGRRRRERWGPRTIDIDILAFGDLTLDEPDLMVPHPRLTERAFALVPLAEIAPDLVVGGRSVRAWAHAIDATGVHRIDTQPSPVRQARERREGTP